MLTILFFVFFIAVFGKLLSFAVKATWSMAKIAVTIILLPFILVGLVIKGLIAIAFPILIVVGIITLCKTVLK